METNDCRNEGEVCNSDNLCECAPNRRLSPGRCVKGKVLQGRKCLCANTPVRNDILSNFCILGDADIL